MFSSSSQIFLSFSKLWGGMVVGTNSWLGPFNESLGSGTTWTSARTINCVFHCYNWFYHTWYMTLLWPSMSLCKLFGPPLLKWYFDDPRKPLKNTCLLLYVTFKLIHVCTCNLLHYSLHASGNVHKNKKKLELSSMSPE